MWLTAVSIRRPVFIIMVVFGLIVLGGVGTTRMPLDLYPDIDFPILSIITVYPGAGPEEVEEEVTKPLEDALSTTPDLRTLTSTSQENVSTIVVELQYGIDLEAAAADARDRISIAKGQLPDDAEEPQLLKLDIGALPVLTLGLFSDRPPRELREMAEDVVRDRLARLPGVATIGISGGLEREIRVSVDKDRLDALGLGIADLAVLLAAENLNVPSGQIKEGRKTYSVRLLGRVERPRDLEDIQIVTLVGTIRLGDIATVEDTVAERETITRINQRESVTLTVAKQSDANTIQVADAALRAIEELRDLLPRDVELVVAEDNSEYIREALWDVQVALLLGALLASLICLFFLQDVRATVIVALAIPTSIMATFLPISLFGFTLNMLVMLGLALCVGILVDDSIVVIENISRHLRLGEQPAVAALNGRTEIGFAAITITLVDVVVFVPVAFMRGIVGQFFFPFGITIAIATLFSLFMSFTLTPMLASRFFQRIDAKQAEDGEGFYARLRRAVNVPAAAVFAVFNRLYDGLDATYRRALRFPVRSRFLVRVLLILLGFAALVVTTMLVFAFELVGQEFFPEVDEGRVTIQVQTPVGTRLEATDDLVQQIEAIIADKARYPEVEQMTTVVGSYAASMVAMGGTEGDHYAEISLVLVGKRERQRSDQDVMRALRDDLAKFSWAELKLQAGGREGGGTEAPIQVEVYGPRLEDVLRTAEQAKRQLEQIEGLVSVDLSWEPGQPEIQARIDRQRASELGLTAGQAAAALRMSIAGDDVSTYREGGKEYDVRLQLREADRTSVSDVGATIVGSRLGLPVRLRDIATLRRAAGPTKLERKDRQRLIYVTANLEDIVLGKASALAGKAVSGLTTGNITVELGGQTQRQQENFAYIFEALLIAIALVYMLMAALFNTLRDPLVIMFSLPMALVGALLALAATGYSISIVSMIGIIMLMGIVGKNSILMVDYTNTLRARGEPRAEAVLEAGPTRMRPILMTTIATIFGVLPTALALAQGSEWRAPMAVVVIGGLILSTLLSLLMIPIMYMTAEDITDFFRRLWYLVFRGWTWQETRQLTAEFKRYEAP